MRFNGGLQALRDSLKLRMPARRGLAGLAAVLLAGLGWAALSVQALHRPAGAAGAPSVELTSQEILPPASQNKRLVWLEINPGGYDVESVNYHPLRLSEPECDKGMVFSPRLRGEMFEKGRPLVFSWAIRADLRWLCLEMVASTGEGRVTSKLYALLQIIKPEAEITDRPTVEITNRYNTSSPGRKLIWIKIVSNGYDIKDLNYHPLPLSEADCHKETAFRPLIGSEQLAGQPEVNLPLAISSKGSYFCVEVVYADSAGQASPDLYLSIPIEEVVKPVIAEFLLQSGPAAEAPDPTPAATPETPPATPPAEDNLPDGNDAPRPVGPENDGGSETEPAVAEKAVPQARQERPDDSEIGNDSGLSSTYFRVLVFVVVGALILALTILFAGKRR